MTDPQLAAAIADTNRIEYLARQHWQAAPALAEREHALAVVRQVTAVQRLLGIWQAERQARLSVSA